METSMKNISSLTLLIMLLFASPGFGGEADVIDVQVSKNNTDTYRFDVTISHKDTGWEHYANKWDILDNKEKIWGTRILHHPHVDEQPFTRSLSGIKIPANIKTITIRAHDSVHAYGGKVITINLP